VSRTRLGLLGGTFDPVHRAHLRLAEVASSHLELACVLLIPAADPPLKEQCRTPAEDRCRMAELAVADHPGLQVCRIELERSGKSYTADTLETLRSRHADVEFWFLVGSDALKQLDAWHQPDRVLASTHLGVVQRTEKEHADRASDVALGQLMPARFAARYTRTDAGWIHESGHELRLIPFDPIPISSSQIRERLRTKQSVAQWVPEKVVDYIQSHELYQEAS